MAKKKKDEDTGTKVMWIAGAAAVTAFAVYFVNRHLTDREELQRLRYQAQLKEAESETPS